jgi:hypothetical protein
MFIPSSQGFCRADWTTRLLRTSYLRDTCEGCRSETWGSGLQTVKNAYFGPGMEMQWLVTLVCVTHYWITDHCCGNVPRLDRFDPFWFADSCCATDSSFPGLLNFYFSLHLSYLCSSRSSSTNTKKTQITSRIFELSDANPLCKLKCRARMRCKVYISCGVGRRHSLIAFGERRPFWCLVGRPNLKNYDVAMIFKAQIGPKNTMYYALATAVCDGFFIDLLWS